MAQQIEHLAFSKMGAADDHIEMQREQLVCILHGTAECHFEVVAPGFLYDRDDAWDFRYQYADLLGRHVMGWLPDGCVIVSSQVSFL